MCQSESWQDTVGTPRSDFNEGNFEKDLHRKENPENDIGSIKEKVPWTSGAKYALMNYHPHFKHLIIICSNHL